MNHFKFEPLQEQDLNLLYVWFQEPTINQWYARNRSWSLEAITEKYKPRILDKEFVPSFIVYKNDSAIGFIQYYLLGNDLPEGIRGQHNLLFKEYNQNNIVGIDLFIAEKNRRDQGLGVQIIHEFIDEFLSRFSAVVVDPDVSNLPAIRCYEKAGFTRTLFSEDPKYLVMIKPIDTRVINPDMLQTVREVLQEHLAAEFNISSSVFLSEPKRRNIVLRIALQSTSNSVPKSIILKQSLPEQSDADDEDAYARFARDWAGLEFLSGIQQSAHTIPKFYGASKKHRFILIEDLGHHHISLVDSLTLPHKDKAVAALSRFMKALGTFHATSFGQTREYETILRQINDKSETLQEELDFTLGDLLPKLEYSNQKFGLSVSTDLTNEAVDVITSMLNPGPFTVLTHGDICPDNVFDHEDSQDLQLIDFEWAFVRNALLDGTYLRMSMPTCWCAKAIPNDLIESLEHLYRAELKRTIPAASDDLAYTTAYTKACAFWVLQQTLPFLEGIFINDRVGPSGPVPEHSLWKPEDNLVRPRFLSRLQSFIDVAARHNMLPHLRQMASSMLVAAKTQWPDAGALEFYPAFLA